MKHSTLITHWLSFFHKDTVKLYIDNSGWLFAERVLSIFSSLLIGIWIARYLGPEQYGLYSYIIAFVAIFASFANLGVDQVLYRELVKKPENINILLGTAFSLKILGSLIAIILMQISLFSLSTDSAQIKTLTFILSISLISTAFNVIDFYFQSVSKNKFPALSKIISQLIISVLKIFCILTSSSVLAFIIILLLDSMIIGIAFVTFFMQEGRSLFKWKFDQQLAKNILIDSWPLILSGISIALYMRIDQMMINEYLGFNALGQYSVALRISEAWYFIPQLLGVVLSPAIFRAKEKDEKLYYEKIQSIFTLMVWLSIIVAIITSSLSTSIIPIIFGPDYQEAGKVLQIHIWSGIFLSLGIASGRWFLAENYTLGALYKSLLGLFVNIIGNLILIPMYGINGAAFSTLIAHFSANVLYDFFDNKARVQLKYKFRAFFPLYLLNDKKRY